MTGRHSRPAMAGAATTGAIGSASVGAASVGSASVGTASVGTASMGRASVRPAGPDSLTGPTGPTPPRSRAEERLAAKNTAKARKRRRRHRRIIAGCAALLLIVGIGTIAAGYYFTSVPLPGELKEKVPSTFYFSNGKPMARLGSVNGSEVDINKLPAHVKYAVVSAEDRTFYTNSGVDFKGILRATWGHLMGNDNAGGASTITMQYAKLLADRLQENRTYTEKLKETVIALKLDQKYSKDQILGFYLDLVYFNRGAYGIDAAAQAYFGEDATQLTAEQAAVLAADIKDPTYYDPSENLKAAQGRWEYVLQGMKKAGYYHKKISLKNYPKVRKPDANDSGASFGLDKPTGNVVWQIEKELVNNGYFDSMKEADDKLRTGGYKITTTINPKAEADAVHVANKYLKPYQKENHNKLADALVAVQPGTGNVVAYYGGNDGTGYDNAGNPHEPGSSFKIYTLAAALNNGYSINSYWDGDSAQSFPGRGGDGKVHNADGEHCDDGGKATDGHYRCSLKEATVMSLNTVFYDLTRRLGREKVIDAAHKSGINDLWTVPDHGTSKELNLNKVSAEQAAQTSGVGDEVGFGQNPVTPLEHAEGTATFANDGKATTGHFIVKMTNNDGKTLYTPKIQHTTVFDPAVASDIDYVLQKVPTQSVQFIEPHRPQANKTGTWQYGNHDDENSQAWTVGYIPQLAAAAWVGGKDGGPIYNQWGAEMYGWDAAGTIWAQFMSAVVKDLKIPPKQFPDPQHVGNPELGPETAKTPSPSPSPSPSTAPTNPLTPSPSPSYGGPPWQRSPTPSPTGSPCWGFGCPNASTKPNTG